MRKVKYLWRKARVLLGKAKCHGGRQGFHEGIQGLLGGREDISEEASRGGKVFMGKAKYRILN